MLRPLRKASASAEVRFHGIVVNDQAIVWCVDPPPLPPGALRIELQCFGWAVGGPKKNRYWCMMRALIVLALAVLALGVAVEAKGVPSKAEGENIIDALKDIMGEHVADDSDSKDLGESDDMEAEPPSHAVSCHARGAALILQHTSRGRAVLTRSFCLHRRPKQPNRRKRHMRTKRRSPSKRCLGTQASGELPRFCSGACTVVRARRPLSDADRDGVELASYADLRHHACFQGHAFLGC